MLSQDSIDLQIKDLEDIVQERFVYLSYLKL